MESLKVAQKVDWKENLSVKEMDNSLVGDLDPSMGFGVVVWKGFSNMVEMLVADSASFLVAKKVDWKDRPLAGYLARGMDLGAVFELEHYSGYRMVHLMEVRQEFWKDENVAEKMAATTGNVSAAWMDNVTGMKWVAAKDGKLAVLMVVRLDAKKVGQSDL